MLANGDWVAYGMRGNVVRSTDRGATWTHVDSHVPVSYFGATQLADGELVLVGRDRRVARRRLTFDVRKLGGVQSLAAVLDMGHGALLLGGEAGVAPLAGAAASTPS